MWLRFPTAIGQSELRLSQQHKCRRLSFAGTNRKAALGGHRGMDFAQCVNSHSVVNWEEDHSSEMPGQCQRFGLRIGGSSARCGQPRDALGPPAAASCCLERDFTVASQWR